MVAYWVACLVDTMGVSTADSMVQRTDQWWDKTGVGWKVEQKVTQWVVQ